MAQNLEIVRRWYEPARSTTSEASSVIATMTLEEHRARVVELWDPDSDYYPARKFTEARPCHGVEQIAQFLVRYGEAWVSWHFEIRELFEVGDDRVLAWATIQAEGRGSGMGLAGDIYACHWLRHGRIFRGEDHLTLRGALSALGLEEETLEAAGLLSTRSS